MTFQLAPSLLAADFWNLGQAVEEVVQAGAQVLHVDVMDGHFVPNLTMGPVVVKALRSRSQAILDVHLMLDQPDRFVEPFAKAGSDWISFHIEAPIHHHRTSQMIRAAGCKAGIAINPGTPIHALEAIIHEVDFVLLMSVNPGFGGQSFIPSTYRRLTQLAQLIDQTEHHPFIQIDGGIGPNNVAKLHQAGMRVAVAGSSIFGAESPAAAVHDMIAKAEVAHG